MKKILGLAILLSFTATAALPPLSEQKRAECSTDILTGVVNSMTKTEVEVAEGAINDVYQVHMSIDSVEKGHFEIGAEVKFSFWKANKRPQGWAGPSGQYGAFTESTRIRAYLINDDADFRLLEPNGFDVLE